MVHSGGGGLVVKGGGSSKCWELVEGVLVGMAGEGGVMALLWW